MTSSCGIRGYYPATLSCSQVHATNLNMKYRSTDARSSKQLRDLTKKIRYQDSSPSQVGLMTTNMTRPVRRQFYKYLLLYWSTQVHIYILHDLNLRTVNISCANVSVGILLRQAIPGHLTRFGPLMHMASYVWLTRAMVSVTPMWTPGLTRC